MILFSRRLDWRLIFGFGIPGIIASFAGAQLTSVVSQALLARVIGGLLAVCVLLLIMEPAFRLPKNNATAAAAGGAVSGFLAGFNGISGPVRSAFLVAFDLPKVVCLGTGAAIAFVIDSTRLQSYLAGGTRLDTCLYWGLIAFIPASLLGAALGRRFVHQDAPEELQEDYRRSPAGACNKNCDRTLTPKTPLPSWMTVSRPDPMSMSRLDPVFQPTPKTPLPSFLPG
jgi:hypothetical protein